MGVGGSGEFLRSGRAGRQGEALTRRRKEGQPRARGLSLSRWGATARVNARDLREPVRAAGGWGAGPPGARLQRGAEGRQAGTRKASRRGRAGHLHRRAPAGRGQARRNTCGSDALGVQRRGLPARARRLGVPRLPPGPWRTAAGAPGVALAADWAGAGPSSTSRRGATVRVRGGP